MTIQLTASVLIAGASQPTGTSLTLNAAAEAELVNRGVAVYTSRALAPGEGLVPVMLNAAGQLLGPDGLPIAQRLRATPLRVATFGDSTASLGTSQGANEMDGTVFSAPFPASGTTILKFDADKWAAGESYPVAWPVFNGGIIGETTTQMIARDAAVASATRKAIADAINASPDVVIVRAGSINDLLGMTAANTQADIDGVYNRHIEIITKLMMTRVAVIDEGFYGYSPASGTAADLTFRRAAVVQLNARYKAFAATYPDQVRFVDWVGVLTTADGNYLPGVYESSGVHLNKYGAQLAGEVEANIFKELYGSTVGNRFFGPNLIANALMANTSSAAYGTYATGFTVGVSGATRQNAKIEIIDGQTYQTAEYVVTAASQYGTIYIPFTPASMGIAVNDVYGFEVDLYIENMSGGVIPAPNNQGFNVDITKTAAGTISVQLFSAGYTVPANGGNVVKAHVAMPFKFTEASAAIASGDCFMKWGTNTLGTYKLGISNPRIVKLGVARVTQ